MNECDISKPVCNLSEPLTTYPGVFLPDLFGQEHSLTCYTPVLPIPLDY